VLLAWQAKEAGVNGIWEIVVVWLFVIHDCRHCFLSSLHWSVCMTIMTFLYFSSLYRGPDCRRLVYGVWPTWDFTLGGLYCIIVWN
jgi:hypothetical protein